MSHPEEICGFIWKKNNKTAINDFVSLSKFSSHISNKSHSDASSTQQSSTFFKFNTFDKCAEFHFLWKNIDQWQSVRWVQIFYIEFKPRTFRRPDTRHLLCCLLVNGLFCWRQAGKHCSELKKGRVKLQEPGFRCCCEYQLDAARFYFQGTTGTPGGGLAPRAFTLCSGHRTEKFSSFNTQPEETHTKKKIRVRPFRVRWMFQIECSVRHLTGWHICSESSWRSPSGNSPLLHLSAGTWSTAERKKSENYFICYWAALL